MIHSPHTLAPLLHDYHSLELQAHVSIDDVVAKVSEELYELTEAIETQDPIEIQSEARDVLTNILSASSHLVDVSNIIINPNNSESDIWTLVALWSRQTATLRGRFSRGTVSIDDYRSTLTSIISRLLELIGGTSADDVIRASIAKFSSRVDAYLPDIDLKSHIAEYPDFPKLGILFRDISPLLADAEAMRYVGFELAKHCQDADVIAGLDARGFIFATLVAQILDRPLVMIRKTGKLPGSTIDESYDLEYGSNSISVQEWSILPGQRVALIDDLLATGGTMQAAARLVERVGGMVDGVLCVIALDEPFLAGQPTRESIESKYNTKSILHYS